MDFLENPSEMVPGSEIPVKKWALNTRPPIRIKGVIDTIAKNMPDSESLAYTDHNSLIL